MKKILLFTIYVICVTNICYGQIVIGLVHQPTNADRVGMAAYEASKAKQKPKNITMNETQYNSYVKTKKDVVIALMDASDQKEPKFTPTGGALTFPFKYRYQNNVLEPTFSLSGVCGVNCKFDKISDNLSSSLLIGLGSSSITINKNNSTDTTIGGKTKSAATLSLTCIMQWSKIQLAISIGWDNNLDNSTDKWIYQSKPWLAMGIGFDVFSSK